MKLTLMVLAISLAAPVSMASAFADEAAAPAAQTDQAGAKKEKLICRRERATGSRVRVNRTCMTEAQWRELSTKTEKGMNDISRDAGRGAYASGPFGGN